MCQGTQGGISLKKREIFFCRKCGTLDYAEGRCPKCGNTEIDRADIEFLRIGSSPGSGSAMSVLLTGIRPIEKIGWN